RPWQEGNAAAQGGRGGSTQSDRLVGAVGAFRGARSLRAQPGSGGVAPHPRSRVAADGAENGPDRQQPWAGVLPCPRHTRARAVAQGGGGRAGGARKDLLELVEEPVAGQDDPLLGNPSGLCPITVRERVHVGWVRVVLVAETEDTRQQFPLEEVHFLLR